MTRLCGLLVIDSSIHQITGKPVNRTGCQPNKSRFFLIFCVISNPKMLELHKKKCGFIPCITKVEEEKEKNMGM